ncbi:hypothetical protein FQR65_LT01148 [Abscondita terminalis]|nr:hypothetical protein FQR65_LT01148 [Abscondita terminalis]
MNGIYCLLLWSGILALAYSAPQQDAKIISQSSDTKADGGYAWSYDTDNGIKAHETGTLKKASGPDSEDAIVAEGGYEYKDLEGNQISLTYIADDVLGFVPSGAHLPTPPPIPPIIARALEWIKAHPSKDSQPGR